MKLLATVFAAILFFAMLPGFVLNVMPLLALFGKLAAAVALAGLAVSLIADAAEIAGDGDADIDSDSPVGSAPIAGQASRPGHHRYMTNALNQLSEIQS